MIVIHTTIPLDPTRRDEAMDRIAALVDHTRSEDGTVRYRATRDLSEPDTVRFFEQYEDAAAARAHTESEPYRRFVEALPDVVDGDIETLQFETATVDVVEFTADEAVAALE